MSDEAEPSVESKSPDFIEECQRHLANEYRYPRWQKNDFGKVPICIPEILDLNKQIQTRDKNALDYQRHHQFIAATAVNNQGLETELRVLHAFQRSKIGGILINGIETRELSLILSAKKGKTEEVGKIDTEKIGKICKGSEKGIKNSRNSTLEIDFLLLHPQLGMVVIEVKSANSIDEHFAHVFSKANKQLKKVKERLPLLYKALTGAECNIPVSAFYCFPQLEFNIDEVDVRHLTSNKDLIKKLPNLPELNHCFPREFLSSNQMRNFDAFWRRTIKNHSIGLGSDSKFVNYFDNLDFRKLVAVLCVYRKGRYLKADQISSIDAMIGKHQAANWSDAKKEHDRREARQKYGQKEKKDENLKASASPEHQATSHSYPPKPPIASSKPKLTNSTNAASGNKPQTQLNSQSEQESESVAAAHLSKKPSEVPQVPPHRPQQKISINGTSLNTTIHQRVLESDLYSEQENEPITTYPAISTSEKPPQVPSHQPQVPSHQPQVRSYQQQPETSTMTNSVNTFAYEMNQPSNQQFTQKKNPINNKTREVPQVPLHQGQQETSFITPVNPNITPMLHNEHNADQQESGRQTVHGPYVTENAITLAFWNNSPDYKMNLNSEQEEVRKSVNDCKNVVILGPPGTGKTILVLLLAQEAAQQENRPGKVIIFVPTEALAKLYEVSLCTNRKQKREIVINPTREMVRNIASKDSDDDVFVDEDFGGDWLPAEGRGKETTKTVIAITAGRWYTPGNARILEQQLKNRLSPDRCKVHRLKSVMRNTNQIYGYFFQFLNPPKHEALVLQYLRRWGLYNPQNFDRDPTSDDIVFEARGHEIEGHIVDETIKAKNIAECSRKICECILKLLRNSSETESISFEGGPIQQRDIAIIVAHGPIYYQVRRIRWFLKQAGFKVGSIIEQMQGAQETVECNNTGRFGCKKHKEAMYNTDGWSLESYFRWREREWENFLRESFASWPFFILLFALKFAPYLVILPLTLFTILKEPDECTNEVWFKFMMVLLCICTLLCFIVPCRFKVFMFEIRSKIRYLMLLILILVILPYPLASCHFGNYFNILSNAFTILWIIVQEFLFPILEKERRDLRNYIWFITNYLISFLDILAYMSIIVFFIAPREWSYFSSVMILNFTIAVILPSQLKCIILLPSSTQNEMAEVGHV